MKLLTLVLIMASGRFAIADQCAVLDHRQAVEAVRLLTPGTEFIDWCEPCGEKRPTNRGVVKVVENKEFDDGSGDLEVFVNGDEKDLAYVYIFRPDGTFGNMAKLV